MRINKSNIWDSSAQCIVIPCNSTIKKDNELVMGAGLAKQAKEKYSTLPITAGKSIKIHADEGFYGFIEVQTEGNAIGLLQTKYSWRQPSTIDLVRASLRAMRASLEAQNKTYAMPIPGTGCGGLSPYDVIRLMQVELEPVLHMIEVFARH